MTAAKHTPGPWFADTDRQPNWGFLVRTRGGTVAEALSHGAATEANARLIAAAPELLAAAWDAAALLDGSAAIAPTQERRREVYEALRAAIAKAGGR